MRADPEADEVLQRLVDGQREALGPSLVGAYLFGSAVTEDYEPSVSDVDTVAVLRAAPTARQLVDLDALHRAIVVEMPEWDDRIECVYLSSDALRSFRTASSPAARVSPGEPFHAIRLDRSWVLDWYPLRTVGVTLWGPRTTTIVPSISQAEYIEAVRRHLLGWPRVDSGAAPRAQAYAILTMCRGLRTVRTGELVSKREAARWGCEVIPKHAQLIEAALTWRAEPRTRPLRDGAATIDTTRRFIADVQALVR
jgi:hypothetical protein